MACPVPPRQRLKWFHFLCHQKHHLSRPSHLYSCPSWQYQRTDAAFPRATRLSGKASAAHWSSCRYVRRKSAARAGRGLLLSVGVSQSCQWASNSHQRLYEVCRINVCGEICLTGAVKWVRERITFKDLKTRVASASQNKSSNL